MPIPLTLTSLGAMSAEQLRSAIGELDTAIASIHLDDNGEIRTDLTIEQNTELGAKLNLRTRAVAHLESGIREQFDRHPGALEIPFGAAAGSGPAFVRSANPFQGDAGALRLSDSEARSRALRALEQRGRDLGPDQQDRVEGLIRAQMSQEQPNVDGGYLARRLLITESQEYRSAWARLMTSDHPLLTEAEIQSVRALQRLEAENRAMSEGTTTAGGYGVPVFLDPSIVLSAGASVAPVLDIARVETVTSNIWKGVSSAPPAWSWDLEGAAVSDDSPTLAQPVVNVYTGRGFIPYSIEVEQDYPSFAAEMSALLSAGYLDLLASSTITGTGTNQMWGALTRLDATTTSEVRVTTAGTFDGQQVFRGWNALPERFRARATWLMSVSMESQIRSFGAAPVPSSYFTVDMTQDGLSRLNGRPVRITDYMPAFVSGSTSGNYAIVGDFGNYVVASRAGMQLERIPMLFDSTTGRPTGNRGFFGWARSGADWIVPGAARLINQT
jgi:HK97 family phage major capsid protein